jgi:hypothetical protein
MITLSTSVAVHHQLSLEAEPSLHPGGSQNCSVGNFWPNRWQRFRWISHRQCFPPLQSLRQTSTVTRVSADLYPHCKLLSLPLIDSHHCSQLQSPLQNIILHLIA